MSYVDLIRNLGADVTRVDPAWLAACESNGVSPVDASRQIQAGTAPLVPPFAPNPQAHVATGPPLCPQCGGLDATVSVPVVFAEGQSSGTMAGGTYSRRGGFGVYGGVTSNQSSISRILSPPFRKRGAMTQAVIGVALASMGLLCLIGSSWQGALIWGTVGGTLVFVGLRAKAAEDHWNNVVLPEMYESWRRSFFCRRCNVIWDPVTRTLNSVI